MEERIRTLSTALSLYRVSAGAPGPEGAPGPPGPAGPRGFPGPAGKLSCYDYDWPSSLRQNPNPRCSGGHLFTFYPCWLDPELKICPMTFERAEEIDGLN